MVLHDTESSLISLVTFRVEIDADEWQVNGAGFAHSHKHGFGLIDSWRLVTASQVRIFRKCHFFPSNHFNSLYRYDFFQPWICQ